MAAGILFDLTRSFSRLGRGVPTGIDRVERALFEALDALEPVDTLVRRRDLAWVGRLTPADLDRLADSPLDMRSRLAPWRPAALRRAEAGLRASGLKRLRLQGAAREGRWLFCAGHNLPSGRALARWRRAGGRLAVLVHDLIPLDHPDLSRPVPAQRFARAMADTASGADLVLHLTEAGRAKWLRRFAAPRHQRHEIIAMGRTGPPPQPRAPSARPSALMVGTIEPRKGHAMILDLWPHFADGADLLIAGGRGWCDAQTQARLDARPAGVVELGEVDDAALAALYARAHVLLFPSRAEGYGLPVMEARLAGLPVIASDLPELKELHGEAITRVPDGDPAIWELAIRESLRDGLRMVRGGTVSWASWHDTAQHIRTLLNDPSDK